MFPAKRHQTRTGQKATTRGNHQPSGFALLYSAHTPPLPRRCRPPSPPSPAPRCALAAPPWPGLRVASPPPCHRSGRGLAPLARTLRRPAISSSKGGFVGTLDQTRDYFQLRRESSSRESHEINRTRCWFAVPPSTRPRSPAPPRGYKTEYQSKASRMTICPQSLPCCTRTGTCEGVLKLDAGMHTYTFNTPSPQKSRRRRTSGTACRWPWEPPGTSRWPRGGWGPRTRTTALRPRSALRRSPPTGRTRARTAPVGVAGRQRKKSGHVGVTLLGAGRACLQPGCEHGASPSPPVLQSGVLDELLAWGGKFLGFGLSATDVWFVRCMRNWADFEGSVRRYEDSCISPLNHTNKNRRKLNGGRQGKKTATNVPTRYKTQTVPLGAAVPPEGA